MSSGPMSSPRPSLALRLTLWYSGIFAISCALAFAFVYVLTASTLQERRDDDLREDVADFTSLHESEGQERIEQEMRLDTTGREADRTYFRLWTRGGELIFATDLTAFPELALPPERSFVTGIPDTPLLATQDLPGREHPVRVAYGAISAGRLVEIGESL